MIVRDSWGMYLATGYQQSGSILGFGSNQLREANNCIASARKATPGYIHDQFRSGIRHDGLGYNWYWILI